MDSAALRTPNSRQITSQLVCTPSFSVDQFFHDVLKQNHFLSADGENGPDPAVIGLDLNRDVIAAVLKIENFSGLMEQRDLMSFERSEVISSWKRKIENSINGFFTKGAKVSTAYLGNDNFLVVIPADGRNDLIKTHLKRSFKAIFSQIIQSSVDSITVGFGNSYKGMKGLIESSNEAMLALKLGSKLGGKNKSYDFDEFGILYTLADGDLEKRVAVAEHTLAEIDKRKKLEQTLKIFFDKNLNISDTAKQMRVHRNTVVYRLKQIARKIGLDPQKFDQAVIIKTALLIKKLA